MLPTLTALALLFGAQQPAQPSPAQQPAQPAPAPKPPPDVHADHPARAAFLANCAQCHGETGDGHGTTKLDRVARSFQDGGFSYGNTPEALARTITYGIPGTPMPSFEKALGPEQRRSLAEYVLLLGPPVEKTDPKDSIMVVRDRPLIVRGKLPPLVEGGPAYPRGLIIGTPEGLSFEYRTDDVRLLGVLSGDFVDRADWRGRGGDALAPLGKVVWTDPLAAKQALFSLPERSEIGSGPIGHVLRSSSIVGGRATLAYDLMFAGQALAVVEESAAGFSCELGAGFVRRFRVRSAKAGCVLRMQLGAGGPDTINESYDVPIRVIWSAGPSESGMRQVVLLRRRGPKVNDIEGAGGGFWVGLRCEPDAPREFDLIVLPRVNLPTEEPQRRVQLLKRILDQ